MANNVIQKPIPITLDKERTLVYDFNAFIDLEDIYDDVSVVFDKLQKFNLRATRDMLWAGLRHEDESLTPRQVGKWLNLDNVQEIAAKVMEAVEGHLPEPEGKKLGELLENGTGTSYTMPEQ